VVPGATLIRVVVCAVVAGLLPGTGIDDLVVGVVGVVGGRAGEVLGTVGTLGCIAGGGKEIFAGLLEFGELLVLAFAAELGVGLPDDWAEGNGHRMTGTVAFCSDGRSVCTPAPAALFPLILAGPDALGTVGATTAEVDTDPDCACATETQTRPNTQKLRNIAYIMLP